MEIDKKINKTDISFSMLKGDARKNLKRHYFLYVVACLVALVMQAEFITSDYLINMRTKVLDYAFNATDNYLGIDRDTEQKVREGVESMDQDADLFLDNVISRLEKYNKEITSPEGAQVFGRTKGVLNQLIDYAAGDTFFSHVYSSVLSITGDPNAAHIAIVSVLAVVSFVYLRRLRAMHPDPVQRSRICIPSCT